MIMMIGWISMAKKSANVYDPNLHRVKKRTSIGYSVRSKPNNKSKKLSWKKYRGQGR